jgi:F-type H+-transporting ATPase subunit b
LRTAAADEGAVATVFSGVTMDSASKGRITRAIHDIVSSNLEVRYQDDPNIVLGVRLTIGDYSAEWSAERYLKRLETELQEIIDAGSRSRGRAVDLSPESGRETV